MKKNSSRDLLAIICGTIVYTIIATSIICYLIPELSWVKIGSILFLLGLFNSWLVIWFVRKK
ncbi:MAG: hypothetical protein LBO74_15650 [Candidatus Symbiothrix sp.]|jgi:hypothetical protein|nr:hypothetical protein [Candidatus Symbiothrix sp.]